MTKQELIKEAWGKNYNEFSEYIDSDGWGIYPSLKIHQLIEDTRPIEFRNERTDFRPKSLQGIENNNGWIKIDFNNLILPVDGTEIHFYNQFLNENGLKKEYHKGVFNSIIGFTSYYDSENYKINEVTHYQPIEKPKPPLY